MKKIFIWMMLAISSVCLFSGCASYGEFDTFARNEDASYDIYLDLAGNVGYLQINSIKDGNIDHSELHFMDFKSQKMIVGEVVEAFGNKIYYSIYRKTATQDGEKIVALRNGEFEKEIVFEDNYGPDSMISDLDRNKVYVEFALTLAPYNPEGTPMQIVDTSQDEPIEPFALKGAIKGYDFKGDYIYVVVTSAGVLKYKDVPHDYIASIHRDTYETKILTKNGIPRGAKDLGISPNGKLYVVSSPMGLGPNPTNDLLNGFKLRIYEDDGTWLEEIELDRWANRIVIDKNGIAYISHQGLRSMLDDSGYSITVFDTNKDEIIGKITGFNGPTDIKIKDHYLFVTNRRGKTISVVDLDTREIIGDIPLPGVKAVPDSLVVLKNSNG